MPCRTSWQPQRHEPSPQWNTSLYSHIDSSLIATRRARRGFINTASAPWGVRSSTSLLSSSLSAEPTPAPSPAAPSPPWVAQHAIPQLPHDPNVHQLLGSTTADPYSLLDTNAFPNTYRRMGARREDDEGRGFAHDPVEYSSGLFPNGR